LKYVKETLLKIQKVNENQGRGSSMAVKSGNSAEKKTILNCTRSKKITQIRINNNTRDKNAASTHFKQMCVVICEYVGALSPREDLSIRNSEETG